MLLKEPLISFYGLKKSSRFLQLIVCYYFPFHHLTKDSFFQYSAVLQFVEATIYQIDDYIEQAQKGIPGYEYDMPQAPMDSIASLLKQLDIYDKKIEQALDDVMYYGRLELKIMAGDITSDNIIEATKHRTCDFRLLHRVLHRLQNKPYDEELLSFLQPVETLFDLEEDLTQYKDDAKDNQYNTYNLLKKIYKEEAKNYLQNYISVLVEEVKQKFSALPFHHQQTAQRLYDKYIEKNTPLAILTF